MTVPTSAPNRRFAGYTRPTMFGLISRLWSMIGRKPSAVYYTNGGFGDELMLTAVAKSARLSGRPIHIIATYPDCWLGNRDAAGIHRNLARWHYASMRGWIQTKVIHLGYQNLPDMHIAQQMAAHLRLALAPGWRPVIHTPLNKNRATDTIVMQNSCRGALYAASTKEWSQEKWSELARRLSKDFKLVQIGTAADPLLPAAQDLRGKTTFREATDLIARAMVFIGLESGLQHVAAGVHTPAVIIYGGRTYPRQTGYDFNENITRLPPCAGCGLNTGCPHEMICMEIPVAEVEAAVHRKVAQARL